MLPSLSRCSFSSHVPLSRFKPRSFSSSSSSSSHFSPWSGLQAWRQSPLNENRNWGPNGPQSHLTSTSSAIDDAHISLIGEASSLAELGAVVLSTSDPLTKSHLSHLAYSRWRSQNLPLGQSKPPTRPARPEKPELVSPKEIPDPKNSGLPLNAYMLHNLAHVELNAIDLAWDTVVRFSPFSEILGEGFFADFAHVADDESRHFSWCSQRLAELGFKYGDMPAHNLLWRECEKSSDNVAARLAVIPLVQVPFQFFTSFSPRLKIFLLESAIFPQSLTYELRGISDYFPRGSSTTETCVVIITTWELQEVEARGLDAGPRLVQKLVGFGDNRTSKIVARIADEEVAHVAVGVHWFVSVCQKLDCPPNSTFKDLLKEYDVELKGPFNYAARDEAGIPRDWYDTSSTSNLKKKDENDRKKQLLAVRERLASIIEMEGENSSLSR
ncbi:putative Ferritin-like superfamily [Senna tora]|uniref:Putative Ferritin-like superfamily n=1 Tax=Senna tora TaxID=362788 RepID=A0A834WXU2_9FABA|nr:putative Ferritin-like superfamily [Senna tora]